MALRPVLRRLLTSTIAIYLIVSALGGAVLCEIAIHPPRRPLEGDSAFRQTVSRDYGATLEDAEVRALDGAQLRGWFLRPRNYGQNVVIILHGVADNRLGVTGFASDFLPSGYAVLLPDSRAHGASAGGYATYGVLEKEDVRRWIDWVEREASPRCVYLLGESMGAAIAIQATAADARICATVTESPFSTFRDIGYERLGQMTGTGVWLGKTIARPMIESAYLLARARTGVSLTDASPKVAIAATKAPVLLIHGAADSNISPSASKTLYEAGRDHAELWIVPGAEHCGASSVQPQEFRRRVVAWFQGHAR
jgi:alpha-beta hydrolase superfamily lysophospholipase